MNRPINMGRFFGITMAVFFIAYVAAVALPHAAYIRYQAFNDTIFQRLAWVYERLTYDATPIDVLVVGSSRSARGVNVELVEGALAGLGDDLVLANISEPASGLDIRLTKIRHALETHPEIKLIVLGVVEALPRDGHQAFRDLATPGEIATAPWAINRNLPEILAYLPYRQMELSLATLVPDAFGYQSEFDPERYLGRSPDHRLFGTPDWTAQTERLVTETPEHTVALTADSKVRRWQITPPILPDALQWAEFGVSRHYVREIAELAEANGTKLAFLFLPFFGGYDAPMDADWISQYGPIWNADFLKVDSENYADTAHASQTGVERVAPWIADKIDAYLKEPAQ